MQMHIEMTLRKMYTRCFSNESDNTKANLIIDAFDRIPTTYDVDKVVEHLEKKIQEHERASEYGDITEEYKHLKAVEALKDAIEIVRGGGV